MGIWAVRYTDNSLLQEINMCFDKVIINHIHESNMSDFEFSFFFHAFDLLLCMNADFINQVFL